MNDIMQHVTICVWLLSLSIMFLRFIHVVARIATTDLPRLMMGLHPNKPIVNCKLKMHVIHLSYQTS